MSVTTITCVACECPAGQFVILAAHEVMVWVTSAMTVKVVWASAFPPLESVMFLKGVSWDEPLPPSEVFPERGKWRRLGWASVEDASAATARRSVEYMVELVKCGE